MANNVLELDLRGKTIGHWRPEFAGETLVSGRRLAGRIARHRAVGGGVVLLLLAESAGGDMRDSLKIAEALRRLSDEGGIVVSIASERIASSATLLFVVADLALVCPGTTALLHGAGGPASAESTAALVPLYGGRTAASREDLERWLAPGQITELGADELVRHGFADAIVGSVEEAQRLAADLAAGVPLPPTERRRVLEGRGDPPLARWPKVAPGAHAHIKLLSFNKWGGGKQKLEDVTATQVVITAQGGSTLEALAAINFTPIILPQAAVWRRFKEVTKAGATQGRIVALAQNSTLVTSDTGGRSWTARTLPGAPPWYGLAYSPSLDLFVAVGAGVAASSADGGATWTSRTIPAGSYRDVIWDPDNGQFVAVGMQGVCAISTNGTSWSSSSGSLPAGDYHGVAWNGSIYVAVGTVAASAPYVPNGLTWTSRTIPGVTGNLFYTGVAVDAAHNFLAVGGDMTTQGNGTLCATSANGTSWTDRASTIPGGITYHAVAFGNGLFVAVGQDTYLRDRVSLTRDGTNWKTATPGLGISAYAVEWLAGFLGQRNVFAIGGYALSGLATDPAGGLSLGWH